MSPEDVREQMLEALRRDLVGPLAEPGGHYPGAQPVVIDPGHAFAKPSEVNALLVAADGQEVLAAEPPVARYIVGALYPLLRAHEERELDESQTPAPEVLAEQAAPGDAAEIAARPPEKVDIGEAEPDEDIPAERPGRPSSFALSLVTAAAELAVTVTGARYEPFGYTVAGQARTGWHRVPVEYTETVVLPPDGSPLQSEHNLPAEPLALRVGVHARVAEAGRRLITCYLVNRTLSADTLSQRVLFASRLALRTRPEQVHTYPDRDTDSSAEAASLRLLYRGVPLCAVGHGVDAVLTRTPAGDEVATEALPVARVISTTPDVSDESGSLAVDMEELGDWDPAAVGTVERMIAGYHAWVAGRWRKAQAELSGDALRTATAHLQACDSFAADMAAGWQLALDAPDTVGRCLRWTSTMMAAQRRSYAAATRPAIIDERSGTARFDGPEPASSTCPARWRPFQLAFLLANLAPVVDDSHPRRGVVDVIWMPTGGGKTEAYLALAAFTMLHRRLCASLASRRDAGTAVVMRYTLRLLTAQQVQRAASLICAMERLRANHPDLLGKNRFTIGAWLGTSSTPNHRKDALAQLRKYATKRSTIRPFLLSRCPACAAAMGDLVPKLKTVLGYGEQSTASGPRMRAACPNPACAFSAERTPAGLPVYEVDEDIYAHPPTFVVATVDKFAQMSWNERPRALFGLDGDGRRARRAPELVIQDELHLISGPLGSLVGLYESALAQLFAHDGGVRPHVVAATATTRAYARQSAALYACPREQVRLVPPPELDVDESFFARANTGVPARAFVGVCATGAGRFQQVQMRVLAGLAHAAVAILAADPGAPVDPYWTDVAFFGSLRDLGQAKSLIATDLRGYQWRLVRATGIRTGTLAADGTRRAIRNLSDVELTSSSSTSASEALEKLSRPRGSHGAVDLALATSVIEVGVDVDRLGLLTIVRQPKTASQYIQVAGRVGRDARSGPGLVVVLLNPLASRDVSHYERFTAVHRRLYAAVEPATVTPFTDAALSRGLRGTLASVVRQTRPAGSPAVDSDDAVRADRSAAALAARAVELYGTEAGSRVDAHHQEAADELAAACREQLEWGRAGRGNRGGAQFLRGLETPAPAMTASWAVLTSLRNVDPDAALRIDDAWLPFTAAGTPPGPAGVAAGDTEEEW